MNVEVLENISLIRLTARIPAAYRGQQSRLQADLPFNRPSFLTNLSQLLPSIMYDSAGTGIGFRMSMEAISWMELVFWGKRKASAGCLGRCLRAIQSPLQLWSEAILSHLRSRAGSRQPGRGRFRGINGSFFSWKSMLL